MSKKRILIFDDDKDILGICRVILEEKGYAVFTEPDCNDLFNKISQARPDMIVMDNKMPGVCGVDAIQNIRKNPATAGIPVVMFSANTNVALLAREAGADHFIQKPFDISVFENLLDDISSGKKIRTQDY